MKRILLVQKTTTWERFHSIREGDTTAQADPAVLESLKRAHREHLETNAQVKATLERLQLDVQTTQIALAQDTAHADLVITVGGDGTFLRTAQVVTDTPILGVNSAPSSSVGHYCATDGPGFNDLLTSILDGGLVTRAHPRIRILAGEREVPAQALNDVLFANACPACSTRYRIDVNGHSEEHTSSGVWVGTASGSGSAIKSAGGVHMDPDDPRLQYLVREPYERPQDSIQLRGGFLESGLTLVPRSPDVMVYLDGHHISYRMELGHSVQLTSGGAPLHIAQGPN